jgi:hypothetical protein
MKAKRMALLMTYAAPDAENRLKTQLTELLKLDFEIHTLGLGSLVLPGVSKHFQLPEDVGILGFLKKAIIHLTRSPQNRFERLRFPMRVRVQLEQFSYDLVVTHDLELLPALTLRGFASKSFDGAVRQVDLHELHEFTAPVSGLLGLFWHVLKFRLLPYHQWLFEQLKSKRIDLATVVNKSIGDWYLKNGHIRSFVEIRNAAPYLDIPFEDRSIQGISFLYHGKFAPKRGLENLVEASLKMNPKDSLTFMLTGDPREVENFTVFASSRNPKISFNPPVPMRDVPREISKYDVEIIYFEPVTQNLLYTLPNKFFESIQGRLAILSGPSPEIVRHVTELGNGVNCDFWGSDFLADAMRKLDRNQVEQMRQSSHKASTLLNAATEGLELRQTWEKLISQVS